LSTWAGGCCTTGTCAIGGSIDAIPIAGDLQGILREELIAYSGLEFMSTRIRGAEKDFFATIACQRGVRGAMRYKTLWALAGVLADACRCFSRRSQDPTSQRACSLCRQSSTLLQRGPNGVYEPKIINADDHRHYLIPFVHTTTDAVLYREAATRRWRSRPALTHRPSSDDDSQRARCVQSPEELVWRQAFRDLAARVHARAPPFSTLIPIRVTPNRTAHVASYILGRIGHSAPRRLLN